jgi:hypothetical protein
LSNYFITMPLIKESGLVARLGKLIELRPVEEGAAGQTVMRCDVCLASGIGVMTLSDNERSQLTSAVLQKGAHLVIIPPLPDDPFPRLLYDIEPPQFDVASFGSVKVVDPELLHVSSLDQLTILFNRIIRFTLGKPIAVTSDGRLVAVRYRYRSTWGELVYTTLLLGSTSTRSRRSHRVAFAQALVSWLSQIGQKEARMKDVVPAVGLDFTNELPILLMAVYLAQQDGSLAEVKLKPTVDRVLAKLPQSNDGFNFPEALERLIAMGILSPHSPERWTVDMERIAEEIDRRHLGSYLRRLQ